MIIKLTGLMLSRRRINNVACCESVGILSGNAITMGRCVVIAETILRLLADACPLHAAGCSKALGPIYKTIWNNTSEENNIKFNEISGSIKGWGYPNQLTDY